MKHLTSAVVMAGVILLAGVAARPQQVRAEVLDGTATEAASQPSQRGGFEVWIADQSDTRPGYGGQLLIYEGSDLMGAAAAKARPSVTLDLGAETSDLCMAQTGRNPVRPHMILFNNDHTHAILAFVASGHVVIFDAAARKPLRCIETTVRTIGAGTFRQAHAGYAAPDGSYIVVANQNAKKLERIDTNFTTNTFTHNTAATLDLLTCATPSGAPCEDANLRPINWPICPIVDPSSRYVFVTLRGGGLFVVDAKATPMKVVGEYDRHTVRGNGCGGLALGGKMYINSGGSPVNVSSQDPHHEALYGFDVYRFPLGEYSAKNAANQPAPEVLFTKAGIADSHGMTTPGNGRYLWAMDRHNDVIEVIDVQSGKRVNTIALNGRHTDNAAPDLTDVAPAGTRVFVALRGPTPLSGDPHNAIGSTPGLGIISVKANGGEGELEAIIPMVNPMQQPNQAPDPHALRVRIR